MVNFKGVAADVPFSAAVFQLQSCERTVTESKRTNEDVDREIRRARKLRKASGERGERERSVEAATYNGFECKYEFPRERI